MSIHMERLSNERRCCHIDCILCFTWIERSYS
jgi:hypothetical protein